MHCAYGPGRAADGAHHKHDACRAASFEAAALRAGVKQGDATMAVLLQEMLAPELSFVLHTQVGGRLARRGPSVQLPASSQAAERACPHRLLQRVWHIASALGQLSPGPCGCLA